MVYSFVGRATGRYCTILLRTVLTKPFGYLANRRSMLIKIVKPVFEAGWLDGGNLLCIILKHSHEYLYMDIYVPMYIRVM